MKPGIIRMGKSHFKSQFGRHLLCVRRGAEIVIFEEGTPVAILSQPQCRCSDKGAHKHEETCPLWVQGLR